MDLIHSESVFIIMFFIIIIVMMIIIVGIIPDSKQLTEHNMRSVFLFVEHCNVLR